MSFNIDRADYSRVWTIYEMLHPKPEDLINPERFFVREGELYVWDEKTKQRKKRHFFLFNDVLLLTKKEGSRKFWLRIYVSLRSPYVNIDDGGDSPYNSEFRLNCRARSFLFFAPTPDVKEQWVRDMRQSITGGLDKAAKEIKKKEVEKQAEKTRFEPLRPLKKVVDDEELSSGPLLAPPPKTGSSGGLGFGIAPPPQSKNSLQINIKPAAPANNHQQGIPDFIDFGSQKSVQQMSTSPSTNPFLQPQTSQPLMGFPQPQQPQQSLMMGQPSVGTNNPFTTPAQPQPTMNLTMGYSQPQTQQQPMYSQQTMGMQPLQMTYPQSPSQQQQPAMNMGYMQPSQPQQQAAFNPFSTPSPQPQTQPSNNQAFNPFLAGPSASPSGPVASPSKPATRSDDPFADLFVSVGSNQPQSNQTYQQPQQNNKANTFDFLM
jgi:hypothetical protein